MAIKQLWRKIDHWWSDQKSDRLGVEVGENGLISESSEQPPACEPQETGQKAEVVVKKVGSVQPKDSAEVLGGAFNRLIDKLQGINEHLDKQITQHEELMQRMERLPDLLESLPGAVENQKQVVNSLIEQLKRRNLKDAQFAETIEKIPAETTKQTNAMIEMNQKLSVATDIDAQMSESFNRFNETLGKLDADTVSQTEGIRQMSKTFLASDRYLKYIISRQNRRFAWVFFVTTSICVFVIISLVICVLLVLNNMP